MKTHLSLHQRIHNADGSQQVENLKAVHAYTHARNWPVEEWSNIWDLSDDCSWAHGFGRWRGGYKVYLNSVTEWDLPTFTNYAKLYKIYPDVMGMDPRPLNFSPVHNLASEIIEVADDGRSARGAFLTPGNIYEYLKPNKNRRAIFMWERYGADFVCDENGEWKYLHEHVCPDFQGNYDNVNWGLEAYQCAVDPNHRNSAAPPPDADSAGHPSGVNAAPGGPGEGPGGPGGPGEGPGGPGGPAPEGAPPDNGAGPRDMMLDDPGPLHKEYEFLMPIQNTCPWPEPYATLDNNNTYTPFIGKDRL
jgi:hypothetical protein